MLELFNFKVLVPNDFEFMYMQVQVYDLSSMSCSYVLAGHSEIILCLDTCALSSGKVLIVTGSKDNSVSSLPPFAHKVVGLPLNQGLLCLSLFLLFSSYVYPSLPSARLLNF